MYVVEGELTVARKPESVIGQYGAIYEDVSASDDYFGSETTHTESAFVLSASERMANFVANRMKNKGSMPLDISVELIESKEQVELFTQPKKEQIAIPKLKRPDVPDLLEKKANVDETTLLNATVRLWKERRIPTPFIYFYASGKLLSELEYEAEEGWYKPDEHRDGERTIKGLVTPIGYYRHQNETITTYA